MKVQFESTPALDADIHLVGVVVEDASSPPRTLTDVDSALDGAASRAIERGHLRPGKPDVATLTGSASGPHRVALLGVGPTPDGRPEALRTTGGRLAATARALRATSIGLVAPDRGADDDAALAAVVEGVTLAAYRFDRYKSSHAEDDDDPAPTPSLTVFGASTEGRVITERAVTIAEATNWARDLANTPGNLMTPELLTDEVESCVGRNPEHLSLTVLDARAIEREGLGLLHAVGMGSVNEPRLIVLEWNPPGANEADDERIAIVGKAITFDSGGISIKPSAGMAEMRSDKAGGCAVIAAMHAIAELGLERRVLALIPAAENMPSSRAYKPGDVFTALDGTTVEVTNTDAEGRLVLADAIAYARQLGCGRIVELSTLTGAMVVALGYHYTGCVAEAGDWTDDVLAAAARTGDHAWHLPMHEAYMAELKSDCADIVNSGGRPGGSLSAGQFLKHFAGETPFVHLDIAGAGLLAKPHGYYSVKGASGWGVRLLTDLVATA